MNKEKSKEIIKKERRSKEIQIQFTNSNSKTAMTEIKKTLNFVIIVDLQATESFLGTEILDDMKQSCQEALSDLGQMLHLASTALSEVLSQQLLVRLALIAIESSVVVHSSLTCLNLPKWLRSVQALSVARPLSCRQESLPTQRFWIVDSINLGREMLQKLAVAGSSSSSTTSTRSFPLDSSLPLSSSSSSSSRARTITETRTDKIIYVSPFGVEQSQRLDSLLSQLARQRVKVEFCSVVSPILRQELRGLDVPDVLRLAQVARDHLNVRIQRIANEKRSFLHAVRSWAAEEIGVVRPAIQLIVDSVVIHCSVQMAVLSPYQPHRIPGDSFLSGLRLESCATIRLDKLSSCFLHGPPLLVGMCIDPNLSIEQTEASGARFRALMRALQCASYAMLLRSNALLPYSLATRGTSYLYVLLPPAPEEIIETGVLHRIVGRESVLPGVIPSPSDDSLSEQAEAELRRYIGICDQMNIKEYDPLAWSEVQEQQPQATVVEQPTTRGAPARRFKS